MSRFGNALITEYTLERDEDGRDTFTITLRAASVEVSPS